MSNDADLLRRLETTVAKMPRIQRQIFLAHRLDCITYAEIANRMGLTHREVEREMARALAKLDSQLEGRKLTWWERWF